MMKAMRNWKKTQIKKRKRKYLEVNYNISEIYHLKNKNFDIFSFI